jgi:hypothetical protein
MFDLQPPRHISTLRILPVPVGAGERPFTEPEPDIAPIELDPAPGSTLGRPLRRALVGCEGDLGRLPIRGVDQPFPHQQQDRKDQGIDLSVLP